MELTIEQIIAKKDECIERFKKKYVNIGSKFLGGSVKFHSLDRGELADIRDMIKSDSEKGLLYFIYLSSDTLRNKELLKSYGFDKRDQHKIVEKLFNEIERQKIIGLLEELNGLSTIDPDAIYKDEVEDLKK
ncbi:hypothetical protein [Clostridium beijerinckii]|uniref:hypothetical protein n=1 Tax=Clostridium beijerinckii TaxID=1520 RepID=UPI00047E7C0D|nr:hypothetical protein [Clostridium beijerinckii]